MERNPDRLAGKFQTAKTGGILTGFLAEEPVLDRSLLLRLGAWGVTTVCAVSAALVASQSSLISRRDLVDDVARQSQQIRSLAKENQNETRRLASAIDTLNGDRDRLYSRVTVLEQGLDSVTGAIARKTSGAVTAPPLAPEQPALAQPAADPVATQNAAEALPKVATPAAVSPPSQSPAPAQPVSPVASTTAKSATGPMARQASGAIAPKAARSASAAPESPSPMQGAAAAQSAPPGPDAAAKTAEKPAAEAAPAAAEPAPATIPSALKAAPNTAAATPATPLIASQSMMAPPDPAATKLLEPEKPAAAAAASGPEAAGSAATEPDPSRATSKPIVKRTEFAVDVGGASSVGGLRAMWRGLLKSDAALAKLDPIIMVKEGRGGLGMQLRLAAGPLDDAAAAAKICAALSEKERPCEPTVFDGQRLAMKADEPSVEAKSPALRPVAHRRSSYRRVQNEPPPKKPEASGFSSLFGRR
jgi:hypothetical protein